MTHGEWLPDSRRVVAIAKEGPGRHAVLLADSTGAEAVRVLHRFASEHDFPGLAVAPDGSAFTFVAPAPDGYYQLFRRAIAGGAGGAADQRPDQQVAAGLVARRRGGWRSPPGATTPRRTSGAFALP